ncbi:hypothetical protein N7457_001607 [Penicillium paradoxum]|uniref:uncharacterized protein n=1 Tax=Penicillium paradoxum TaxID=176176 RepID=UPI002547B751|nr:uncharacterized protein N7457_001607 [Penicillium paradoxum]KAJ5795008.1 hypothetical protein N7457_001607 [Penicillium paradoxum]
MDANTTLSPITSAPSFPAPSSPDPRKRSIHEVDDAAMTSPNAKRPLTDHVAENQENRDPSLPSQSDENASPPVELKRTLPPRPTVEIVVRRTPNRQDLGGDGASETKPPTTNAAPDPEADTPAAKKRKLASAAKDSKQQEKEAKERQKAEEKAKKEEEKVKKEEEKAKKEEEKRVKAEEKKKRDAEREEEKRLREEEKRKKDAQREEERKQRDEKKKAKEDEKAAKEEEKRKKDEEKEKKTRSQMKLNSFFAKPPAPSASPGHAATAPAPRKLSTTADPADDTRGSRSDYEREFPAFFLQSHTTVAPSHRFERDSDALRHVRETIDASLSKEIPTAVHPFRPSEVFQIIPFHRRGQSTPSVKNIVLQLQKSEDPNQPTQSPETTSSIDPRDLLRKITMKSLKFGEDIRPPYQGTYTRQVPESSVRRLARNPYFRGLPDTNYDYDSEAEWEEPEEGEELDSEEEDEGSDEGEDDLDGFLDDEDDALAEGKRRLIVGDLEPVSTGIKWAANGVDPEMQVYQIETISDAVKFPIDPFSTAYWEKPKSVDQAPAKVRFAAAIDGFLVPAVPGAPAAAAVPPTSKAKRPFPPDQLAEFKEAVEGSDLSKIGLVEILKKRFPKVSKETLKATLDQVAVRVGQKEVDKKWVCR